MANPEHLEILKQGVEVWNKWREKNRGIKYPDLREVCLDGANLSGANLSGARFFDAKLKGTILDSANLRAANFNSADLSNANLHGADLSRAKLHSTDLSSANLSSATLDYAILNRAVLRFANLGGANLNRADLSGADLSGADFNSTNLIGTNFSSAILDQTIFNEAAFAHTVLTNADLSQSKGLALAGHYSPSSIGIDTLYLSKGQIPEVFLRGCGVPDSFITQARALIDAEEGIQFYSCFISYSGKDEEFARRLHARLQQEHVRVWLDKHDMKAGEKIHEQIDSAIKVRDKLLLLLSPHSLKSNWVITELRKARKEECKSGKLKLFPIRLMDMETLQEWECFDSDTGSDLAVEVRQYFIPDFTHWKDHDAFEAAFAKLLKDLRASEQAIVSP